jgi:hypothetical protein
MLPTFSTNATSEPDRPAPLGSSEMLGDGGSHVSGHQGRWVGIEATWIRWQK